MDQPLQPNKVKIEVPAEKARQLQKLSTLSVESLNILAEKSGKSGIERKLQTFKNLI
jgi:hypothetical protein